MKLFSVLLLRAKIMTRSEKRVYYGWKISRQ
jgi:hypothetical protein